MRAWILLLILLPILPSQAWQAPSPPPGTGGTGKVTVPAGTKIPLVLKQSISTRNARSGDPVYASTNFPVVIDDQIVIPAGSYVQGVVREVKRAGRVKGRAEILVNFRSLILPSGYTVLLPGAVEGAPDSEEGKVKDSEGTIERRGEKGKDARTVATAGGAGAGIGAAAGGLKGAGIGGGIGAAGGLIGTLLTRGSDLRLPAGTTVDMVLERSVVFDQAKLRASQ